MQGVAAGQARQWGGGPGGQEQPTLQMQRELQTRRKRDFFRIRSVNTLEEKKKKGPLRLVRKRKKYLEERTMRLLIKLKETNGPSRIYCGRMWIYSVQKITHMEVD